jgi:protein-L-isoaspartate O-methyltransferase
VNGGIATLFPFIFAVGQSVLEIAAGSGRDSAAFLQLGVDVHAVEPSAALRSPHRQ